MKRIDPFPAENPLPPACRPTVDRLQLVLDSELPAGALDADPHLGACAACRERVAAARLILSALAVPAEVAVPSGLADRIVAAAQRDRRTHTRRVRFAFVGGLAVAAAVVIAVWLNWGGGDNGQPGTPNRPDVAKGGPAPEIAPDPRPAPDRIPEPRPLRIGDELSKASQALRDAPRPLTDPAAAAPELVAKVTDALTRPMAPGANVQPARAVLAELPDAARASLEPVTDTAQKAFARLIRDVGSVGTTRPKS